jgi:tRNA modification GTPase
VIQARGDRALAAAQRLLGGALGRHLAPLTGGLLDTLARVEAYIDFPDEDLPAEDRGLVQAAVRALQAGTRQLLATQRYGDLLRDGVKTVIVGAPNVGKSSLLNRLVGHERALVGAEPGTTRDFIEERIIVGPHCLRLVDTAGLNPRPQALEERGIAKTREQLAAADLRLLVLDASRPGLPSLLAWPGDFSPANTLVVLNKADLGPRGALEPALADFPRVAVSALTGEGLAALTAAIGAQVDRLQPPGEADGLFINARHADALGRAEAGLAAALRQLEQDGPVELLASDLRGALSALGELAGKIDNERTLDRLFAAFCIGK